MDNCVALITCIITFSEIAENNSFCITDKQNARMESERALQSVIFSIMADNMELFKQFNDNPSFKKWLSDLVFNLTYNPEGKPFETPSNDSNNK